MITTAGTEITRATAAHKYGGDPMAEYLYDITLNGCADEESGTVESPTGWFARVGRRIVTADNYGFVDQIRYDTVNDARIAFDATARDFRAWAIAVDY